MTVSAGEGRFRGEAAAISTAVGVRGRTGGNRGYQVGEEERTHRDEHDRARGDGGLRDHVELVREQIPQPAAQDDTKRDADDRPDRDRDARFPRDDPTELTAGEAEGLQ